MSNIFRLYFEKFSANALPMGKIFAIIREKFLDSGNTHAPRHRLEKKDKDTFLIVFFSLVRKERKGQKEERIDSRLGDADTHASHMCQSLF